MMIITISIKVGASKWEEDDTMMLLPMLFAWHLIANLLLQVKTFKERNDKKQMDSSGYENYSTDYSVFREAGS